MFKNRVLLFFFVLGIFFLCREYEQNRKNTLHYQDQDGEDRILSLPKKDIKRLQEMMHVLFAEDSFAYTILGSKPMSWACYKKPFLGRSFQNFFSKYNRKMDLGWKTWQKYRHLFPHAFFWSEEDQASDWISIILVNEKIFDEIIIKNKKDFQVALNREEINGSQLLEEAKHTNFINKILKNHQALIGILLGYGRDNSWKFWEACEKHQKLQCVWADDNYPYLPPEDTLKKNDIEESFYYSCPSFAGDPSSKKSLALKKDYFSTREKICCFYKNKDFLEATLSLLAGYVPRTKDF